MSNQLDLFGDHAEQTQSPAFVPVRSHMRRVKNAIPEASKASETVKATEQASLKPRVASPAPQPEQEAVSGHTSPPPQPFPTVTAPHNHTQTSAAAARSMNDSGAAQTQAERVYAAVLANNATGLTREQVQEITGLRYSSCGGRVKELLDKGKLIETGIVRHASSGLMQAVLHVGRVKHEERQPAPCGKPEEAGHIGQYRWCEIEGQGYLRVVRCLKCGEVVVL